jgi:hypothetical protein
VVSVCDGRGCGAFGYHELWTSDQSAGSSLSIRFDEYVLEGVIVVVGVDEVDDLVASGLVDHPEAVPPICSAVRYQIPRASVAFDRDLARHAARDARCAAACCILPAIGANRAALLALSASLTSASASAVRWTAPQPGQPPSLRFLGRKVYLATIVVLVSVTRHGVTKPRIRQLAAAVGVDRRTVARWRAGASCFCDSG